MSPRTATGSLTDADVITAIRANHLKVNISEWPEDVQHWGRAWVDPGGAIFGPGPYVKLPVGDDADGVVIRVYAPARRRRRLAERWTRRSEVKPCARVIIGSDSAEAIYRAIWKRDATRVTHGHR